MTTTPLRKMIVKEPGEFSREYIFHEMVPQLLRVDLYLFVGYKYFRCKFKISGNYFKVLCTFAWRIQY